jgi:hypothetical protein
MTQPRPFRPIDLAILILILAAAAASRGWYLTACADGGRNSGPVRVQDPTPAPERDALVRNLAEKGSFSGPSPLTTQDAATAHVAPGYPWLPGADSPAGR